MMRALIVLLLLALVIAFAGPSAHAESGDAVDVVPAEQSDTEAAENSDTAPKGDAEEVITSSADIPLDKLVEPPPERTPIENIPMPGITFTIKDFYQKLPTPEEWELVMAAILGLKPPPSMQPPLAKAPPSKEPVKPKGEVPKPGIESPPVAIIKF